MAEDIFSTITTGASSKATLRAIRIPTILGDMIAIGNEDVVYHLGFIDEDKLTEKIDKIKKALATNLAIGSSKALTMLQGEVTAYLQGNLREFKTEVEWIGTEFQKECWQSLRGVPYGETLTYGDLAQRLGRGKGHSRAVGGAVGANPVLLLAPCHRVVGSTGQGGFSCGIDRKKWLLKHEEKFQTN